MTMTTMTYEQALGMSKVTVPPHLEAQAEVPVLTGEQRQGDLLIVPAVPPHVRGRGERPLPARGVRVVESETTGNTHFLHQGLGSMDVTWNPAFPQSFPILGWVEVPEGQTAVLIHTEEHGANAMGPGLYEIRQRRQQAAAAVIRSAD